MPTKYYATQFIRLELDENLCPRTPTKGTPVYKASDIEAWLEEKRTKSLDSIEHVVLDELLDDLKT